MTIAEESKRCTLGVWDNSVPGIIFDDKGISNYARIQQKLMETYPRGPKGKQDWDNIVRRVKTKGKNNKYDCIVGVSGGVDSSYLLYLLKEKYELKPLAVTLDNGWSSEIAVNNIKLITDSLNVDLETYVINYEEIKDLLRAYMIAGLPWIDTPTDTAIKSVMYKIALQEGIKFIFRGNDFRTEGKQPREWTYSDGKQLKYVHKKFGQMTKLITYPYLPFWKIIYAGFIRGIKDIRPFYYLDYSKAEAKIFLEKEYGWQYYGGHHHENIFTKFAMSVWLPDKFGIDKRIINLSAQVMSSEITREEALNKLSEPSLKEETKGEITKYVLKKLELTENEFFTIMTSDNKSFRDYPNYEHLLFFVLKFLNPLISLVYPQKPMTFVEMEMNSKKK
jgi:N-acetyl sugar amidotransferase